MPADERRVRLRDLAPLMILALAGALFIAAIDALTRERIESSRQRLTLGIVLQVMPLPYDNGLLGDSIGIPDPAAPAAAGPTRVYRARHGGEPAGVVFMPVRAAGYNGLVELAIGVSYAGELTGVRVVRQAETPGLGDRVDQARSEWIRQFDGRSLENTAAAGWAVRSDGGEFDQISGATVTPRGVIRAVRAALEYYAQNRDALYR